MTDKEWYAQLSTLVLEGIDALNADGPTYWNMQKIRNHVMYNQTQQEIKRRKIENVFNVFRNAMVKGGYIGLVIFATMSCIMWLEASCGRAGIGTAILITIIALLLGAIGLAGQIWEAWGS